MALDKDGILVINTPPSIKERRRILKSGKTQRRFSIEVHAEPVIHVFNEREMGRAPAEAITSICRDRLVTNTKTVSAGTVAARQSAARSFAAGNRWAVKRYSGGRIGATPPDPNSTKYGVDSGRLANNLFARFNAGDKSWTTNAPANRLTTDTFTGPGFEKWLQELERILDIKSVVQTRTFQQAQIRAINQAISVTRGRLDATRMKALREALGAFRMVGGLVQGLV